MLARRYPDLFHGRGKKKRFFEGWYFKLADASKEQVYAFISGIHLGTEPEHHHSFIQILEGRSGRFEYLKYSAEAFQAEQKVLSYKIADNVFRREGLFLDALGSGYSIHGALSFSHHRAWPDSGLSPGSMGFYNYLPAMQCYSQVCAMDMEIQGSLWIGGQEVNFSGGRGYIEKNWGKAFPHGWIWVQCNHFNASDASVSVSLGHIPFISGSFRGFLIGLYVGADFYAFTTMNKSRLDIEHCQSGVRITAQNKEHILTMDVDTQNAIFTTLQGPRDGRMIPLVQETLTGRIELVLKDKHGHILLSDVGQCTGVEYGGDQMLIAD
jgi:hypothetical protein